MTELVVVGWIDTHPSFISFILQVPAAFIFILHFLLAAQLVPHGHTHGAYQILNVALIIR